MRDFLLVLAGGGAVAALLKFIEYLIEHKTHIKERAEDRKEKKKEQGKKELEDLREDLRNEFKEGLKQREETGKERFDINSKAIDENTRQINELLSISNQLKDNSNQLKDNVILLTQNISQIQDYNINVGKAINGIIHDRIVHNVDAFVERNGITSEEISTLKSMYYPYKKLGGNGDVETAFEIAIKLPPITKEEAVKRDLAIKRNIIKNNDEDN